MGIDWRLAYRCAYAERSLGVGVDCLSTGLWRGSGVIASEEKDFGSKPRGDGDRMKPLAGRDGARWPDRSSSESPMAVCDPESGDTEGAPAGRPSLEDPGDEVSGFAMRSPPRDWARLRSPSIVASL